VNKIFVCVLCLLFFAASAKSAEDENDLRAPLLVSGVASKPPQHPVSADGGVFKGASYSTFSTVTVGAGTRARERVPSSSSATLSPLSSAPTSPLTPPPLNVESLISSLNSCSTMEATEEGKVRGTVVDEGRSTKGMYTPEILSMMRKAVIPEKWECTINHAKELIAYLGTKKVSTIYQYSFKEFLSTLGRMEEEEWLDLFSRTIGLAKQKIDGDEALMIFSVLAKIPASEREGVITLAREFIGKNSISSILSALGKFPTSEREEVVILAREFIDKNGISSILSALEKIPASARGDVVTLAKEFIKPEMNGLMVTKTLERVGREKGVAGEKRHYMRRAKRGNVGAVTAAMESSPSSERALSSAQSGEPPVPRAFDEAHDEEARETERHVRGWTGKREANNIAEAIADVILRGETVDRERLKQLFEELRLSETREDVGRMTHSDEASITEGMNSTEFINEIGEALKEGVSTLENSEKAHDAVDDFIKTLHSFESLVEPSTLQCGISLIARYMI